MKRNQLLHLLFAIIVIIELIGRFVDNIALEYPVKPLIMIWIAVYFLLNRQKKEFTRPVLLAFFFSWLGDILLMLSGRNEMLFYAGVGGFFFAQIFYIYTFTVYPNSNVKGLIQKKPLKEDSRTSRYQRGFLIFHHQNENQFLKDHIIVVFG